MIPVFGVSWVMLSHVAKSCLAAMDSRIWREIGSCISHVAILASSSYLGSSAAAFPSSAHHAGPVLRQGDGGQASCCRGGSEAFACSTAGVSSRARNEADRASRDQVRLWGYFGYDLVLAIPSMSPRTQSSTWSSSTPRRSTTGHTGSITALRQALLVKGATALVVLSLMHVVTRTQQTARQGGLTSRAAASSPHSEVYVTDGTRLRSSGKDMHVIVDLYASPRSSSATSPRSTSSRRLRSFTDLFGHT